MYSSDFADFNPRVNYSDITEFDPLMKYKNDLINQKSPFEETDNIKVKDDSYYCGGNSSMVMRTSKLNNTKVSEMFFSNENIARIQRKIKKEVLKRSRGKYRLDVDQNERDLLLNMRAVYLDNAKHLDHHIVKQVKILNEIVLNTIMPDVMTNILQYYDYLRDITQPVRTIPRPLNVASKGRKSLPSTTTTWK